MLLHQLSYAIKNQLKALKAPYWGHFLPFAGYLCHKWIGSEGLDEIFLTLKDIEVEEGKGK